MKKQTTAAPSTLSRQALWRRVFASYWIERTVFVGGAIIIFYTEQIVTPHVETAHEDVAYYERNVGQIQISDASRKHWLAEYNRSVASKPQDRDLIAQTAFQLFADTDQMLSGLRAAVEQEGRGEVFSVLRDKNNRRHDAEQELKRGDADALVKRVDEVHTDHQTNVEPLTVRLMQKRQQAIAEETTWSRRLKIWRLIGTIVLASAFLLREGHEYHKRKAEQNSPK